MDLNEQRSLGETLAQEANAPLTLAAIRDPDACFDTILTTAVNEVGAERLVEYLRRGDPMWAYHALRRLPEIDAYRSALLAKAAEDPHSAAHALRFIDGAGVHEPALFATAQGLVQSTDVIDKFEFDNDGVYIAYFAMKWINNGTVYQVTRQNGNWDEDNPWPVGGGGLWKGDHDKVNCINFANASHYPLSPGDQVWVSVQAEGGDSAESAVRVTYQPNAMRRGKFVAQGSVRSVSVAYGGSWEA